ncbi:hypothetical protein CBM2606_A90248 [Cupriavidus taiwanensis]|nr:hypothetical protein CBM2606_A90248 [Cupriavidus taiwanensis]
MICIRVNQRKFQGTYPATFSKYPNKLAWIEMPMRSRERFTSYGMTIRMKLRDLKICLLPKRKRLDMSAQSIELTIGHWVLIGGASRLQPSPTGIYYCRIPFSREFADQAPKKCPNFRCDQACVSFVGSDRSIPIEIYRPKDFGSIAQAISIGGIFDQLPTSPLGKVSVAELADALGVKIDPTRTGGRTNLPPVWYVCGNKRIRADNPSKSQQFIDCARRRSRITRVRVTDVVGITVEVVLGIWLNQGSA